MRADSLKSETGRQNARPPAVHSTFTWSAADQAAYDDAKAAEAATKGKGQELEQPSDTAGPATDDARETRGAGS